MALDHSTSVDGAPAVSEETTQINDDPELRYRFVSFYLGEKHYCIPARAVAEVIGPLDPTPLPDSPRSLTGIAPHRGDILAVVDLGVRSNNSDPAKRKAVVLRPIGEKVELAVAFNVDRMGELLQVGAAELTSSRSGDPLAEFETPAEGGPVLVIEPIRIADLVS